MSTYQGPHVAVTQKFELSPPAVAIEDLPSVVVGTAYDVYDKESLGMAPSLTGSTTGSASTSTIAFGVDKVVFDHTVVGKRGMDFYPPKAYVRTENEDFEIENEDIEFTANGIVLDQDDTYPLNVVAEGESQAYVPYYTAAVATISASDLQTINVTSGTVVTAKIQKGQTVIIGTTPVGVVGSTPSSETVIKLAAPYSVAITGALIVGVANSTLNLPDCFFDPNADFVALRTQIGDVLEMNTNDLGEEIKASIVSIINKNMLRLQTAPKKSNILLKLKSMDEVTVTMTGTFSVGSYKITRPVSFAQCRYEVSESIAVASKVDTTKFKVLKSGFAAHDSASGSGGNPEIGFWFTITPSATQETEHTRFYKITSLFDDGTNWVIGTDQDIYLDGTDTKFTGTGTEKFNMWEPQIENEIIADFRAVRTSELGIVKRITSDSDITTAWSKDDNIDVHNELAWMASTQRASAGGKVIYGVNVDASDPDLAGKYAEAFDALKIYDVYSHAIGTTDSGVNATVGAYLEQQSDPYQGHERIAVLSYDQDSVFAQGENHGNMAVTGIITLQNTDFDPISAGVTVDDEVDIFDADDVYEETVKVISTPDPIFPTFVSTDYDGDAISGNTHKFKFKSGRPADQAIKIGAIKYGNRRVKTIWPGYFYANIGNTQMLLPPYYIAADIAGRDGRITVSQSFTNMNFTPYGMSNLIMNTNFRFTKDELDTIGSGGIDIMIQDASLTQSIKSRHDLTSNMDAIEYREWSITKQADVCAKTYRAAINPYVGKYNITDGLLRFISTVCAIVGTKLTKTPGIVAGATTNSVKRDEVIADKINIYITIVVFVAGNYYDIELLIKSR